MHATDETSDCSLKFTSSNNTREDIYTMEYYSAIKTNTSESVLMRWMNLEPIIQSEVSQKKKHKYHILMHMLYVLYVMAHERGRDPTSKVRSGGCALLERL